MCHQGPFSLPGPRVNTVEDADVEQVLEDDVKRGNEIAYDFVGDVVAVAQWRRTYFDNCVSQQWRGFESRWFCRSGFEFAKTQLTILNH